MEFILEEKALVTAPVDKARDKHSKPKQILENATIFDYF